VCALVCLSVFVFFLFLFLFFLIFVMESFSNLQLSVYFLTLFKHGFLLFVSVYNYIYTGNQTL
jgi:hypothetical protein